MRAGDYKPGVVLRHILGWRMKTDSRDEGPEKPEGREERERLRKNRPRCWAWSTIGMKYGGEQKDAD